MEMMIDFPGGTRVDAHFGSFTVHTDQPVQRGGENSAPTPFALFLAAIGTCAGFYVHSFCAQRDIATSGIRIIQKTEEDVATKLVKKISLAIEVPADFPSQYVGALVKAAAQCTVKKHLEHAPEIEVAARSCQAAGA